MSIFDRIKNAIFGEAKAADTTTETPSTPASPTPDPSGSAAPAPAPTAGGTASSTQKVDIEPILDEAVRKNGQKLDWRHSIVDLMKALGMDASLSERKELAAELGYTGDTGDSATMNMWLHKALLKKLSENGGKVPADLLD